MMRHSSYSENVWILNFPKNSPFGANRPFGSSLAQKYAMLYLMVRSKYFFETLPLYDGALRCTKVRSVSILKKVSISGKQVIWTRIGPKIMQPFVSILADFLKYCHMIGHNRKTKVIINFPKKSSLGQMYRLSQYDPKLCNHISHDLLLWLF